MACELGISAASVARYWRKNGLKPHLVSGFKVSRDPRFVEKLEDIVGLYMSPPEHALVLCCDEKSQVQALDRTQPGLPMKKGRAATFNEVAAATINACRAAEGKAAASVADLVATGIITYVPFPPVLAGKYQSHTEADLARLRAAGFRPPMQGIDEGIGRYVTGLLAAGAVNA